MSLAIAGGIVFGILGLIVRRRRRRNDTTDGLQEALTEFSAKGRVGWHPKPYRGEWWL